MPEDQSVAELAKKIQKHQVKTDQEAPADALPLNTLYPVDSSFVNYERVETRSEGRVNFLVFSLDPAKGLVPGPKYNVWLAIKMGAHCFFTTDKYGTCELPDATTSTQVSMATAKCDHKRAASGDIFLDFSMQGEVKRLSGASVSTAGFLLIEQGQEALTPLSVLEGHLQATYNTDSRELLSAATNKFTQHAEGVIVCRAGSINADGSYEINQQEDPDGTLKKGKTYDVFALIERVEDGYYHYYVSQDSQAIKVSEVKMEVAMDSMGAPALRRHYNDREKRYDITELALQVAGHVVSHENTTNPIAGFLFVPQAAGALDNAAARKTACDLIAAATAANPSPTRLPCFATQTDSSGHDYLVCITNTTDVVDNTSQPLGGQYSFAKADKTSHLELPQDYKVYCWAQDAAGQGEVFLSATSELLSLSCPEVKMKVAMDSMGAPALQGQYNAKAERYDITKFALQVAGHVVSHENTTNPIAGFLFVPQAAGALDNAAARKTACDLIAAATAANPSPTRLPCFATQTDSSGHDYLVCITNTTDVVDNTSQPLGGQYSFAKADKTSHLELPQDYKVYCWAQDAAGQGEVFLSATSELLSLFYVQGTLNRVQCVNRNCNNLPLQLDVAINNIRNSNNATMAAVFMRNHLDFDVSAHAKRYSPGWCYEPSSGTLQSAIYTWGRGNAVTTDTYKAVATNGKDLVPDQQYTVHLLVRQGQVVYGIPSSETYDTPSVLTKLENSVSTIPSDFQYEQYQGKRVFLYPSDRGGIGVARWEDDQGNLNKLDPTNTVEQAVISAALAQLYSDELLQAACKKYGFE